eukprot:CAMPEP_0168513610 /NCGR_PEP_ID=MMETSP0405-20121227/3579_1 /TAXON_ID=498012 /ORGANISM="Trichosphaerium sp, Strain Am-I-7 wt" /LENGTH=168 /DNA_ID=CAMNT_0008532503 /DNA_START=14 /DNA_END=520 /DNA_ORIENTATION=-
MATQKLAVVVVDDKYETLEYHYPRLRLKEAGFKVIGLGPKPKTTYKSKAGYWAITDDAKVEDINPKDVAVLVVPGGFCTDRLRRLESFKKFTRECVEAGAVCGFICHAHWLPISAGVLKGKRVTSFFAIKDDIVNAGAEWVDEKCVVDGNMVTAQTPEDLPAFMKAIW